VSTQVSRGLLLYLARALGREEVAVALGADPRLCPLPLDGRALARLRRLAARRLEGLAQALAQEAAASDDVHDGPSALRYLRRRLQELSPVLAAAERERLWAALEAHVGGWEAPFDPREGSG